MAGRIVILIVVMAGIVGIGYMSLKLLGAFEKTTGVEESTYTVVRKNFLVKVIEDGNMESARNIDVKCQVAGGSSILSIVDDGSYVEKGAEIIKLDSSQLEDQINQQKNTFEKARAAQIQAEKDYEVAQISVKEYLEGTFEQALQDAETVITIAEENLRSAKNSLEFSQKMFRKGYLSKLELESQQFSVKRADLELASANTAKSVLVDFTKAKTLEDLNSKVATSKAKMDSENAAFALEESRLKRLEAQLVNCVVKAPQSGMVVYANEQGGRFGGSQAPQIAEGAAVREQQTLVRLPDLTQMQVKVLVHESKVEQLRIGQRAFISVLDKEYQGEVVNIANQPEPSNFFSAGTKEYATIVKVEGTHEGLKPGMTAEVEILITEVKDALTVPVAAVVEANGELLCWVKKGGDYERRVLEVGWSNDEFVEVKSGIQQGDVVLKNPKRFAEKEIESKSDEQAESTDKFGDTSKAPKVESGKAGDGKTGNGDAKTGPPDGGAGGEGSSGGQRPSIMESDADGDGKVSKEEAPERMKSFFDFIDTNKDGFIDKAEADEAAKRRGSGGGGQGGGRGGPPGGGPPAGG